MVHKIPYIKVICLHFSQFLVSAKVAGPQNKIFTALYGSISNTEAEGVTSLSVYPFQTTLRSDELRGRLLLSGGDSFARGDEPEIRKVGQFHQHFSSFFVRKSNAQLFLF